MSLKSITWAKSLRNSLNEVQDYLFSTTFMSKISLILERVESQLASFFLIKDKIVSIISFLLREIMVF